MAEKTLQDELRECRDAFSYIDAEYKAELKRRCAAEIALDRLTAILRKLIERMDSDADGGDGIFEDFVERLANEARAFLATREKTT